MIADRNGAYIMLLYGEGLVYRHPVRPYRPVVFKHWHPDSPSPLCGLLMETSEGCIVHVRFPTNLQSAAGGTFPYRCPHTTFTL
ncbi:hypothetical protein GDO78_017788 [Eleutherodactylus coqui]|uniref:Uncharacterized protein n=1 Tax=Eleutherodactylus coqui TaxID=57060 RepID=A0A8J6EJP2_ELECQ|nr:hypothetical protein GDO78_017788 [Eleutherodactylus coqui]